MLKAIEKLFNVVVLFYMTGAVFPYLVGFAASRSLPAEGGLLIAIYTATACFITLRWRVFLRGAWNAKWIIAVAMVAVASSAWSQDPFITLKSSLLFLAATLYGVYVGSRYTVPDQQRLLACACALMVISSYLVVILLPKYGFDHRIFFGAWQGAFLQKNALASAMVLSVLVFHFVRLSVPKWFRWLGLGGSLCLLALSRSVSGPLVLGGIMMVVLLIKLLNKLFRQRFTFSIPILVSGGLLATGTALVLAARMSDVLKLLGRNSNLTGRTYLWEAVLHSIARRPWLGYGFGAFWVSLHGESSTISQKIGWVAVNAHNFFLDLTLYLGVLGLAVFVFGYIFLWRRAVQITRRAAGPVPLWLFTTVVLMVACSLDESSLGTPYNIFWVLYASTAVNLGMYFPATRFSGRLAPNHEF